MGITAKESSKNSFRDTWAEISLDAISNNTTVFKKSIAEGCRLMAIVKADGYGHGSVEVGKAALEAGADCLGVAFLDEALVLRKNGIDAPILVMGYTPPESIEAAIDNRITVTVFTGDVLDQINALKRAAVVHIKIDSGMGRIGVRSKEEALALAQKAAASEYVTLEGIFTHFSSADGDDPSYTYEQFESFQSIYWYLEANGIHIPVKHCCNSAATIRFPEMHLDLVRVGISLYGLYPSSMIKNYAFPLEQAFHFKTKVVALKTVQPDTAISYGCTFVAEKETSIATIPVGYADGLSRQLSNKGVALIHGRRAPIVGRVCMDQTMLDVTGTEVKAGDEVVLFGGTGKDFLSVDEVADWMGTINYEVVCLIGKRVPRVYVRGDKVVGSANMLLGG